MLASAQTRFLFFRRKKKINISVAAASAIPLMPKIFSKTQSYSVTLAAFFLPTEIYEFSIKWQFTWNEATEEILKCIISVGSKNLNKEVFSKLLLVIVPSLSTKELAGFLRVT